MALSENITTEQIRDSITKDIMPKAVSQWDEVKAKDPEDASTLRWVAGRIDASLQLLQSIDREAFDEWVAYRHRQNGIEDGND